MNFLTPVILSMMLILSSCGAPILNSADPVDLNQTQLTKTNGVSNPEIPINGQNLLKAYGCPISFDKIALCAQIFWFDDEGRPATGPIYWQRYRDHAMTAKILFWSSKDGWPVDPRTEFSEVKMIRIKLFMPSMGHGTMGHFSTVEEVKGRVGQFMISNIRFVMAASSENPWEFKIQLKTEHDDQDFDAVDDPHVWEQKILQFTSLERR